jgi:hypothetical protein
MVNAERFSANEIDAINKIVAGEENPLKGRNLKEFQEKLETKAPVKEQYLEDK